MDDQTGRSYGDMQGVVRRRRRRWVGPLLTLLVLAALVVGGWYGWQAWHRGQQPQRPPAQPPQPVGAATIGRQDIRVLLNALGTVTSLATVTVKTQIAGQDHRDRLHRGPDGPEGRLPARRSTRGPTRWRSRTHRAPWRGTRRSSKRPGSTCTRYQTLLAQDSVSRQQVDTRRPGPAGRGHDRGPTRRRSTARSSTSPTATSSRRSTAGSGCGRSISATTCRPSDATGLVVITQVQPISVVFALPEDDIAGGPEADPRRAAGADRGVGPRRTRPSSRTGTLASIDNQVDVTTGTVKLRAMFANPDERCSRTNSSTPGCWSTR